MVSALLISVSASAQVKVAIHENAEGQPVIPAEIYGQFSEHLGRCIYEGIWVGPDSDIPNIDGYRTDVINALKQLKVPVLRWPGGCFADEYHWMDGIGPRENRPKLVNNNWGRTLEDNSFGTHEFLNLCEMLGTEPYISGNVGSGSVEELAKWVEYMTAENGSMAELRKNNGREKPWKVKYLGIGNETWGCGGDMTAEYYSHVYKRYALYCRNYSGNSLFKVACGASDYDYNWTRVLMKADAQKMDGLSLHYYTCYTWSGSKGSATEFNDDQYYWTIAKCGVGVDEVLRKQIAVMDQYDPQGKVDLLLDEWGTWWDKEPGSIEGHLRQQNSMRDAMVAAVSLNTFHQYTKRLKMCNIAQIANVLQSMVLTKDDKMLLTPTYHVFKMYVPNMEAVNIPLTVKCDYFDAENEQKNSARRVAPYVSCSASKMANGTVNINLANADLKNATKVTINLDGINGKVQNAQILTSKNIADHNTFENPNLVKPTAFNSAKIANGQLVVDMPKASIVCLQIK